MPKTKTLGEGLQSISPIELAFARLKIKRAVAEQGIRADMVSPKQVTAMARRLLKAQEKEEERYYNQHEE